MRLVISYATQDETQATQVEKDLREHGVSPWIFKKAICPSTVWLKEIDEALTDSDFVLGIITNAYISSTGGLEGYATIAKNRKKTQTGFIPLFFENVGNIKSTIIPAISGFELHTNYNEEFLRLLRFLKSQKKEDSSEILSEVESPDHGNPFYRVRTELYGNDYQLIAKAFAEPEATLYQYVQGNVSAYMFGGRGVGKTMLLKSLTPEVVCSRHNAPSLIAAKSHGVNFFGFYFKLKRGSLIHYDYGPSIQMAFTKLKINFDYENYKVLFEKAKHSEFDEALNDPILSAAFNIIQIITLNEFNYKILQTILENLKHLSSKSIITVTPAQEKRVATSISELIQPQNEHPFTTFDEIIGFACQELKKISDYVQDSTLPADSTPQPTWVKTHVDFIDTVLAQLKQHCDYFQDTHFYLLFDEFENLIPVQQTIINEWVKTAENFVVKVSSKFRGMYTYTTFQGQTIQFNQDCPEIILDYNLFDEEKLSSYKKLLRDISTKLLQIAEYKCTDITELLEAPTVPEFSQEVIDKKIAEIRLDAGLDFEKEKISNYREKYSEAAIFRLLQKRKKVPGRETRKKRYAGFDTFTYLSSGIIRVFLNLVGTTLYKTCQEKINVKNGEKIPVSCQSWSAEIVSLAW